MAVNEFEEFRKQYDKTFVRVKFESSKDYQVVLIRQCLDDDVKNPYIVIHNPDIGSCTVNWGETKQSIDYSFPTVGLFNHQTSFMMFHRFPDRQWKRGISSGNSHIADPLRDVRLRMPQLKGLVANSVAIDHSSLTSAFFNSYPSSLAVAAALLSKSNQLGVALSPIFGITKNPAAHSDFVLWKHLSMIGTIQLQPQRITIEEPTFRQEVSDFLKRTQEYAWTLE